MLSKWQNQANQLATTAKYTTISRTYNRRLKDLNRLWPSLTISLLREVSRQRLRLEAQHLRLFRNLISPQCLKPKSSVTYYRSSPSMKFNFIRSACRPNRHRNQSLSWDRSIPCVWEGPTQFKSWRNCHQDPRNTRHKPSSNRIDCWSRRRD